MSPIYLQTIVYNSLMKDTYSKIVLTLILIALVLAILMNRYHFINEKDTLVWRFNKITGEPVVFFPNLKSKRIGYLKDTYQSKIIGYTKPEPQNVHAGSGLFDDILNNPHPRPITNDSDDS